MTVQTVQPEREKTMGAVGAVIFAKNIKVEYL
jgi:activator of 2-hydroxyglutaryl-CoA dehydratase